MRSSCGTAVWTIPMSRVKMKRGLRLKASFPLETEEDENMVMVFCPAFDEYGFGSSFDEALKELGSSLSDLYYSAKKLKNPSDELKFFMSQVVEEG